MNDEILKKLEEITITLAMTVARQRAIKSMVLGVYCDTLPPADFQGISLKLKEIEFEEINSSLEALVGLVPEKRIRQEQFELLQQQK